MIVNNNRLRFRTPHFHNKVFSGFNRWIAGESTRGTLSTGYEFGKDEHAVCRTHNAILYQNPNLNYNVLFVRAELSLHLAGHQTASE